MSQALQAVADQLSRAALTCQVIAPVRDRVLMIEPAYAVQKINTQRRVAGGHRPSGRKVGLTSHAVQKQLGVDQPDFGMLFRDCESVMARRLPGDRFCNRGVELKWLW